MREIERNRKKESKRKRERIEGILLRNYAALLAFFFLSHVGESFGVYNRMICWSHTLQWVHRSQVLYPVFANEGIFKS